MCQFCGEERGEGENDALSGFAWIDSGRHSSGFLKARVKKDEIQVQVRHSADRASFSAECPQCGATVSLYTSSHGLSRKSDSCSHFRGACDAGYHGISLLFSKPK